MIQLGRPPYRLNDNEKMSSSSTTSMSVPSTPSPRSATATSKRWLDMVKERALAFGKSARTWAFNSAVSYGLAAAFAGHCYVHGRNYGDAAGYEQTTLLKLGAGAWFTLIGAGLIDVVLAIIFCPYEYVRPALITTILVVMGPFCQAWPPRWRKRRPARS